MFPYIGTPTAPKMALHFLRVELVLVAFPVLGRRRGLAPPEVLPNRGAPGVDGEVVVRVGVLQLGQDLGRLLGGARGGPLRMGLERIITSPEH